MYKNYATSKEEERQAKEGKLYRMMQGQKRHISGITDHIFGSAIDIGKSYAFAKIKTAFGFEMKFCSNSLSFKYIAKVLMKYDKYAEKHFTIDDNKAITPKDIFTIIPLKYGTKIFLCTKKYYTMLKLDGDKYYDLADNTYSYDVYMYIFGRGAKQYYENFQSLSHGELYKKLSMHSKSTYNFKVSANSSSEELNVVSNTIPGRKLSTVFMENDVIGKVKNHIDTFMNNYAMYEAKNLNFKTGILFKGEPGTGKTTLAQCIATAYNIDIITIDMTTFKNININDLCNLINNDTFRYVILLEDIDCIIGDREDETEDREGKALVNKLLQFLDSSVSPNNVIFIATTNHPEKLDKAITRNGRFDLTVEIKGLHEQKAIEMCKSFDLDDESIEDIIVESGYRETKQLINQSWLQSEILSRLHSETTVIE